MNIESLTDLEKKRVVIAGGGAVGLDCAEFFGEKGAKVTVVERLPQKGGTTKDHSPSYTSFSPVRKSRT